jgi:hypothetical protein
MQGIMRNRGAYARVRSTSQKRKVIIHQYASLTLDIWAPYLEYMFMFSFHRPSPHTLKGKHIIIILENNQQNALNFTFLYFPFFGGCYMFRQNNAILREQLCSFLSHHTEVQVK